MCVAVLSRGARAHHVRARRGRPGAGAPRRAAAAAYARQRAETLRGLVGALELRYRDKPLGNITVSPGVAVCPEHAADADALVHATDEALYAARAAGRNCVVVSGSSRAFVRDAEAALAV